ncbi:hypothetical protein RRG08_023865 [Elysia crispata]|uniref:Uncharacterized protein n=1 Tax=Elysia crispata TaxID=231223 RepID=A0AAE1ATI1_9GAST|nr:hypothetical protein RRG08_023865 [Elysia crispata]
MIPLLTLDKSRIPCFGRRGVAGLYVMRRNTQLTPPQVEEFCRLQRWTSHSRVYSRGVSLIRRDPYMSAHCWSSCCWLDLRPGHMAAV